jgi:hypothetical protein
MDAEELTQQELHNFQSSITSPKFRAIQQIVLPSSSLGDEIKKNEMGGACGTYGRQERSTQGFGVATAAEGFSYKV